MSGAMSFSEIFLTGFCAVIFFGLIFAAAALITIIVAHLLLLISIVMILMGMVGAFDQHFGPFEMLKEIREIWRLLLIFGMVFLISIFLVSGMPERSEKLKQETTPSAEASMKGALVKQDDMPKPRWSLQRAFEKLFWKKEKPSTPPG